MQRDLVDKAVVQQVNKGSEQAFAELYKAYYAYLNAVAIYYSFPYTITWFDPCRTGV